jgi:hypothetical protein
MKPITYSLQFRGQVSEAGGRLRKEARAPGCSLVTRLTPTGVEGHFVWSPDDGEVLFESTLTFTGAARFEEQGTMFFAGRHALHIRGRGELGRSADPDLRQGAVLWIVEGGEGRFSHASGRVTSNFLLSDTGDLTEDQLGVVFANDAQQPPGRTRHSP